MYVLFARLKYDYCQLCAIRNDDGCIGDVEVVPKKSSRYPGGHRERTVLTNPSLVGTNVCKMFCIPKCADFNFSFNILLFVLVVVNFCYFDVQEISWRVNQRLLPEHTY